MRVSVNQVGSCFEICLATSDALLALRPTLARLSKRWSLVAGPETVPAASAFSSASSCHFCSWLISESAARARMPSTLSLLSRREMRRTDSVGRWASETRLAARVAFQSSALSRD